MSYSYTTTESRTFTVTHAKNMAVKVATDLKRLQCFYGEPNDADIREYEEEVIALLRDGFLGTVWYGFKRNGNWIEPTLKYTAHDLADNPANDDDPGRVRPRKNIIGATFYSYLTYSNTWDRLTWVERDSYEMKLPFKRSNASVPGVSGYLENDRTYSSGGQALNRASVRGN